MVTTGKLNEGVVCFYLTSKPWINKDIQLRLRQCMLALRLVDKDCHMKRWYDLRRAIKETIQGQTRKWLQWLHLTAHVEGRAGNYKSKTNLATDTPASLPQELNSFYTCFESTQPLPSVSSTVAKSRCSRWTGDRGFKRALKRLKAGKADPGGMPSCVLKSCYTLLSQVSTDIFNLSLSLHVVPYMC